MQTSHLRANDSSLPLAILGAAIVLGLLGDQLLRTGPLGLNVFLWVAALAAAVLGLARYARVPLRGDGRWLLVPALLFAGAVAWRASPTLQALNIAAVLLTLALAAFRLQDGRIRVGHVTEYAWALIVAAAFVVVGTGALVVRHMPGQPFVAAGSRPGAIAAARGTLVAAPLVLVFGGLFVAADDVFAGLVGGVFTIDLGALAAHAFWFITWGWVAASVLWQCLLEPAPDPPHLQPAPALRLGPIEVGTALGLLDLLFLAFVVVQVRYLFGGAAHVEATTDLTYAEYARRGFFELLAVAALVVPVILGIHWLLRDSSRSLKLAFRLLATGLVLFVFVVISSALKRMDAYIDQFGLTELRLYSTAFMAWLALVFAWLLVTVIRGRRERFAFGAAMAGFLVLGALNVLNPDAFMARTNLARAEDGRDFDVSHAAGLSPDATPTLIAGLPSLLPEERCALARAMDEPDSDTWRTWNYGRAEARDALTGHEAALTGACD
jgi:hypothetical protein